MEKVKGTVSRFLREPDENGGNFGILRCVTPTGVEDVVFSGRYPSLSVGDFVEMEGNVDLSTYQGRTQRRIKATSIRPSLPRDAANARTWLENVFNDRTIGTHGISKQAIEEFVTLNGAEVLLQAEKNHDLILTMSSDRARFGPAILEMWRRRISGRKAFVILENAGIETAAVHAVIDRHKDDTWSILAEDPYRLARIKAFGFKNADMVGAKIGIMSTDDRRVRAAFLDCVGRVTEEGHTYAPVDEVGTMLVEDYDISMEAAIGFVRRHVMSDDLPFAFDKVDGTVVVADRSVRDNEAYIAAKVLDMVMKAGRSDDGAGAAVAARVMSQKRFSHFDEVQGSGVALAASSRIAIVTGGPGTGKSTVSEAIVETLKLLGWNIVGLAPTGMAALRLSGTTKEQATTIHSTMGIDLDTGLASKHNEQNPLPSRSYVVIDESSMVDLKTFAALLASIPPDGGILFVGDDGQLSSVDPGAGFRDLLEAKDAAGNPIIPRVALQKVYRQDHTSQIAIGAAAVRRGEVPPMHHDFNGGLSFREHVSGRIVDVIADYVRDVLVPEGLRGPMVSVLAPQRMGVCGTNVLNHRLSRIFNPDGAPIPGLIAPPAATRGDTPPPIPRLGDRVMASRNDKKTGLLNGEPLTIMRMEDTKGQKGKTPPRMILRTDDGREVAVPVANWASFPLCYATTVHKSQGSQYECVIMVADEAHERMLDRSIVYTGWTRAKSRLMIVGQRDVFARAVERVRPRRTRTSDLLSRFAQEKGYKASPSRAAPRPPTTTPRLPTSVIPGSMGGLGGMGGMSATRVVAPPRIPPAVVETPHPVPVEAPPPAASPVPSQFAGIPRPGGLGHALSFRPAAPRTAPPPVVASSASEPPGHGSDEAASAETGAQIVTEPARPARSTIPVRPGGLGAGLGFAGGLGSGLGQGRRPPPPPASPVTEFETDQEPDEPVRAPVQRARAPFP